MALSTEKRQSVITKYSPTPGNTGSPEVQIALITARLESLTGHFSAHVKDHHSRRGLLKMVGKRKRLLTYLQRKNPESYAKITAELGLRR